MAKFDAAQAVEALEYDFTKYGGTAGVIPEPTDTLLNGFFQAQRDTLKVLGVTDASQLRNRETMMQVMANLPEDAMEKMGELSMESIATLCQGTPALEEIRKLPPRVRNAFMGWLMGHFSPEAKPDGSRS